MLCACSSLSESHSGSFSSQLSDLGQALGADEERPPGSVAGTAAAQRAGTVPIQLWEARALAQTATAVAWSPMCTSSQSPSACPSDSHGHTPESCSGAGSCILTLANRLGQLVLWRVPGFARAKGPQEAASPERSREPEPLGVVQRAAASGAFVTQATWMVAPAAHTLGSSAAAPGSMSWCGAPSRTACLSDRLLLITGARHMLIDKRG